jgi:hypothetical protein
MKAEYLRRLTKRAANQGHLASSSPRQAASSQSSNAKPQTLRTHYQSNVRRVLVHVHVRRDTARISKAHRNTFVTTQIAAMLGVAGMQPRQLAAQVLNFALVLSTAFMLWKGLSVVSDSPSPIVVVLSGSMEPAFQRGDLLFLWNRGLDTQVGEIVVYNVKGKDIPIVHRVVRRYGGE